MRSVQAERRYSLRLLPNDTAFSTQMADGPPGIAEEWWAPGIDLFGAWDVTSGAAARVAIIDTGIDATHPEFAGKIIKTVDYDDTAGHEGARHDEIGHGTHVASLACATPNNAYGIAGSGYNCKLLIAKTDLTEASVAASIVWAVKNKADSINMSFGTDTADTRSVAIERAIDYAVKRNVVLVAAAADEPRTEQGDPANLLQPTGTGRDLSSRRAKGLSVTAATAANQRASFAGRGSQISLAAYGSYGQLIGSGGLLGAFPANKTELEAGSFKPPGSAPCNCRVTLDGDPRFARLQGTSMAAPLVAGVAAMIRALNPDLSAFEITQIMRRTANRTGGWSSDLGWGVMNAGRALRSARNADRRAPTSRIKSAVEGDGFFTLSWTGRDRGPRKVRVSGIEYYDVYKVVGDQKPVRVKRVRGNSTRVTAAVGDGFFTVARDAAGNREAAPKKPDVVIGS